MSEYRILLEHRLARKKNPGYLTDDLSMACKHDVKYGKIQEIASSILPSQINDTDALYHACYKGNLRVVRYLLREFSDTIDVNNVYRCGDTYFTYPIVIAAEKFHLDIVKELLKHPKIDVNRRDVNNIDTLNHVAWFCSMRYGNQRYSAIETIKLILNHPNIVVGDLDSISRMLCHNDNEAFLEDLLSNKDYQEKLKCLDYVFYLACLHGHFRIVKLLFKYIHLIDPNKRISNTYALHAACQWHHYEIVHFLVDQDCIQVDKRDPEKPRQAVDLLHFHYSAFGFGNTIKMLKRSFITGLELPLINKHFYVYIQRLQFVITLISARSVARLGKKSFIRFLSMDLIRLFAVALTNFI